MRLGRVLRTVTAAVVGFVLGAVLTLSVQSPGRTVGGGSSDPPTPTPSPTAGGTPDVHPEPPGTYLAWTPGGLPAGFRQSLRTLPGLDRSVVVVSGTGWMTRSFDADGTQVDARQRGLAIPVEVAGVDPDEYAPFLPPADRRLVVTLRRGDGVLGSSSAELRGLGEGSVMEFGEQTVRVEAVLPDELVGATELLVSRRTAARLGVTRERYALLHPARRVSSLHLARQLRPVIPAGEPLRVRAPGETPFFRHGDAVLPPVRLKQLFGEFHAAPDGGYLRMDPAWERRNIEAARVPILGEVRCHRTVIPQLRAALREVVRQGLADEIHPSMYGGCYSPRFSLRTPGAGLSHHSWGIAIDINVAENRYGQTPTMDPRIVAAFKRHGFNWGGEWLVPDGMHFEFGRFVPA